MVATMREELHAKSVSTFCDSRSFDNDCGGFDTISAAVTAHLKTTARLDVHSNPVEPFESLNLPTVLFVSISTFLESTSKTITSTPVASSSPSAIHPPLFDANSKIQPDTIVTTIPEIGITATSASTDKSIPPATTTIAPTSTSVDKPATPSSATVGTEATQSTRHTVTTFLSSTYSPVGVSQATGNEFDPAPDGNPQTFKLPCTITAGSGLVKEGHCDWISNHHNLPLSIGAIIGIVIGGIALIVLIALLLWHCRRKHSQKKPLGLERTKEWVENGVKVNRRLSRSATSKTPKAFSSKKPKLRTDIVRAGEPSAAIVTEDVLCNYSQTTLRHSRYLPPPRSDPFYTPFDSPDEKENTRASQIGLALTRYSTRRSQATKKTDPEETSSLPDTLRIGRSRNSSAKSAFRRKPVPQRTTNNTALSPGNQKTPPLRQSRSLSSLMIESRSPSNIFGSPKKLSHFYDIHTGKFLNPGSEVSNTATGSQMTKSLGMKRSFTDPKLASQDENNATISCDVVPSNHDTMTSNNAVFTSYHPPHAMLSAAKIPEAFPEDNAITLTALPESPFGRAKPPITECELLGYHVCDLQVRYKCHFSTVQMRRIAGVAKRYHAKEAALAGGNNKEQLQEEKQAWARNLLQKLQEQQPDGDDNKGGESVQKQEKIVVIGSVYSLTSKVDS